MSNRKQDNYITAKLVQLNMTQQKLADLIGVKREYINRIINKKITPTVILAIDIAKALDCPVEDVFFKD